MECKKVGRFPSELSAAGAKRSMRSLSSKGRPGPGGDDDEDLASGEVVSIKVEEDDGGVQFSAGGGSDALPHRDDDDLQFLLSFCPNEII